MPQAYSSPGSCHPAQLIEESGELWDQHKRMVLILKHIRSVTAWLPPYTHTPDQIFNAAVLDKKEAYKILEKQRYRIFQRFHKTRHKYIIFIALRYPYFLPLHSACTVFMIDAILNTLKKTQAFMINISVRFEALTAQTNQHVMQQQGLLPCSGKTEVQIFKR